MGHKNKLEDFEEECSSEDEDDYGYLPTDTRVQMWDGTIKMISSLRAGDKIIGDDGTMRTVLSSERAGDIKVYNIRQALANDYYATKNQKLVLHMPDHKVIFWNNSENSWTVLWWNNVLKTICKKSIVIARPKIKCDECGVYLFSNLIRHYGRVHKGINVPEKPRKSPTKTPPKTPEVEQARKELEKFCESIDDNNVFDISVGAYLKLNKTTKGRLAGVRGECVKWKKQDVVLDPYVLGLWLGDGLSTGYGYVCDGEKDYQLIDYLKEWGKSNDCRVYKSNQKYVYRLVSLTRFGKMGSAPLKKLLKEYDLIQNKHIPEEYILNSRTVRLQVLAGIIDTDGTVVRDGTRIVVTQGMNHTILALNIIQLVRSLGFCCSDTIKHTTWTHKGIKKSGLAHNINISGIGAKDIPTTLPRKKCADPKMHNTSKTTGYITFMEAFKCKCTRIKVSGNHRFIINDHTVVHDSY
jgi:hypothetical protein